MDRTILVSVSALVLGISGLTCPCSAQSVPNPDEEILDGAARANRDSRGAMFIRPDGAMEMGTDLEAWAIPALAVPDFRPRASELLREGAVLHKAQGRLMGSPGGGRVYVFDEDEDGLAPPPMIVIPGVRLMEMERLLSTRYSKVTFLLTGEVFVYHSRNYIQPTRFTTLTIESEDGDETAAGGASVVTGGDDVQNLISSLKADADREEEREGRGVNALHGGLGRDGELLVSKRGRVRRSSLGGWEFYLDNDAGDTRANAKNDDDAPLILLPCRLLEAIEDSIDDNERGAEFLLSGTVHVYSGESYLLPSMFRVVRPSESGLSSGR